jgi:photosystem II stability/assembly factor-like uncharacterized protein
LKPDWSDALQRSKPGGKTLLNISFIDEATGHASGEGGLLLSTVDGGRKWASHELGPATVQAFSFAGADHGIAILSDRRGSMGWECWTKCRAFLFSMV